MHEDFIKRHDFDPVKKITNIECFIKEDEGYILQTNFYHNEERLVAAGWPDA